ncbi:MAG: hypothetical protein NW226_06315 [Microscillaceae bacterium]|nr:hypothetical protein [Microscillaceae bacterium]
MLDIAIIFDIFYPYQLHSESKPTEIKQTQLKLREEFPHPYYWGAFVLIER